MSSASRYTVKSLGCKANWYDGQKIETELQKRGWLPAQGEEAPSLCIVNSCTVTDEADRQSRKLASKMARLHPEAVVVVTGCGAEIEPERMAGSKGVTYVIGNQNKDQLVDLLLEKMIQNVRPEAGEVLGTVTKVEDFLSRHPTEREWPLMDAQSEQVDFESRRTRAFLKIQEGCNSFCTYCIIPYARGPARSLRPREILDPIRKLLDTGVKEIVLTGTNIGDYGSDWGDEKSALVDLVKMILKETDLPRLRLSSLDPTEISEDLLEIMGTDPRLCAHVHLSLQSPHDKILRLMKRKYAAVDASRMLHKLANLSAAQGSVFVGMDLITGFPGEGEKEFEETVAWLEGHPWSRLHVFPYSERSKTPATRIKDSVPLNVRFERTRRLNELSLSRQTEHLGRFVGKQIDRVLVERLSGKQDLPRMGGYSNNYLRTEFLVPHANYAWNEEVAVRATGLKIDRAQWEVSLESELLPHRNS